MSTGSVWSRRVAPPLAMALGLVMLGLGAASVVLDSLTHQPGTGGPAADALITAAGVVPVTAVGVLLSARRPRNPIGWILLAIIIVEASPTSQYLILDYRMRHGALPLGWAAVVLEECWPMFLVLVTVLLWLFPDGTLPAGRWHRAAAVAAAGWLLLGLAASSRGVLVAAAHDVRIQANGDLANPLPAAGRVLSVAVIVGALASWTAWLVFQIPAYRNASGEHRQQLKWLCSGAAIYVASVVIGVFIASAILGQVPGWSNQSVIGALTTLGTAALPVCLGVAVLKYRLYELNRIISRVVSYTLITALLGGLFAGLILLATRVLPFRSSVAVAISTLVIAALFNPLRQRVQRMVDRRFNRSRYDAEAVVAAFNARLRHTVDLDAVRRDLLAVTQDAFQPAHVCVWLAPGGDGEPSSLSRGETSSRRCGMPLMTGMWCRLEQREISRLRGPEARAGGTATRPRPDLPAGTDLLPQIRHIVVLMMENHSYDNYLGLLAGRGEGLPLGPDGVPVAANILPNGRSFRAHHLTSTVQAANNPTQTWHASHLQYGTGACDGFASSIAATVPGADPGVPMGYWTEDELPFYYGLARAFPLADHWFCSCLGPTFPNRRFLISGTAHGLIDDLPWDVVDYPEAGTIFDALTDHGISWVNYHNVNPVRVLFKRLLSGRFLTVVRKLAQVGRWLPRVLALVIGNKSFTADVYPLGLARCVLHLRTLRQFFGDADAGTLPSVSIVDPDFGKFSEENPQDIARGESFAAEVISRVMHGRGWPHTLLVWLYDEHGGYYDHVPPPEAAAPDDVPAHNFQLGLPSWLRALLRPLLGKAFADLENIDAGPPDYARYGFRVPAVIVSPYARPGYVCTKTLDHTSILKLIEQKWNLPPLTRRDAAAESPLDAIDLDAEPAFATPPDLPAPTLSWAPGPRDRRPGP